MAFMSVTLDVSHLFMFALNVMAFWKSLLMSEIRETSQLAIKPCSFSAEYWLSMNSLTAVCRSALLVNVNPHGGDGDGGCEGGGDGGGGEGGGDGSRN